MMGSVRDSKSCMSVSANAWASSGSPSVPRRLNSSPVSRHYARRDQHHTEIPVWERRTSRICWTSSSSARVVNSPF